MNNQSIDRSVHCQSSTRSSHEFANDFEGSFQVEDERNLSGSDPYSFSEPPVDFDPEAAYREWQESLSYLIQAAENTGNMPT